MIGIRLRPARPDEAVVLTALALRSKAHWGYDAAFMAACREELTITEEVISNETCVVMDGGPETKPFALYALCGKSKTLEVENFFIDPTRIGTGLGRRMMEHCKGTARARGANILELDADPFAEPFYKAMGFETIGETPSGSIPGRKLPRMRLSVD